MRVVTSEQMRELEQQAVAAGISLDRLMERAGRSVASAVARRVGGVTGRRIVVLVGPGNNGGDGLVAARHLAFWGAKVTACLLTSRRDPDPKRELAAAAGVQVVSTAGSTSPDTIGELVAQAHAVVDAVLGTGRARPIVPPVADLLRAASETARSARVPVIAVDLPTGQNADTGEVDPNELTPDVVLMLGRPKLGPYLRPTVSPTSCYEILDIGLPDAVRDASNVSLFGEEDARSLLPTRSVSSNKGTFGRAFLVAGSPNYVGAAALAARSAGRVGAGLVTLASGESVYRLVASRMADATYVPLPEMDGGVLDATPAVEEAKQQFGRSTALLVGPGLGQHEATGRFLEQLLDSDRGLGHNTPAVFDADCLNYLATVDRWWERLPALGVVTPHPGEMARLLGSTPAEVQGNRLHSAVEAAKRWHKVVVLKGACTVVADPEGNASISEFANSGLATAGTGDVLAGAIVGLLAQHVSPWNAARLGVYLHGSAGEITRERFGSAGMTASDVLDALPEAWVRLEKRLPAE